MRLRACITALILLACMTAASRGFQSPLPSNLQNYHIRGTQPNMLNANNPIVVAYQQCVACHYGDPQAKLYSEWTGSLMAQSSRDPEWKAAFRIAESDAPGSGDLCLRCHVSKGWVEGRSSPTNGSALQHDDRDGVTCNFCHRMANPFPTGTTPSPDPTILAALGVEQPQQSFDRGSPPKPGFGGNGGYVVDPFDRRRGPFPINNNPNPPFPAVRCDNFHQGDTFDQCIDDLTGNPVPCHTYEAAFHRSSEICATCHDVSLPQFAANVDGTIYSFNGTGVQHPTGNKYDMMPEQRTYSEWLRSDFAAPGGVAVGHRYGCAQTSVSSCQDCHMRAQNLRGCSLGGGSPRPDMPNHRFLGAATWIFDAIGAQYGPDGPYPGFPPADEFGQDLSQEIVDEMTTTKQTNIGKILTCAADLQVTLDDSQTPGTAQLKVRVINQTGHKLPTGYPEGRRMWLTVQFFDCTNSTTPMAQFGAYDLSTATLSENDTKVYEMHGGLDSTLAASLNRPVGPSSHAMLSNKIYKDNRIPPRGFTNANFAAIQAAPVGYSYADGQYWDDTYFNVPGYAVGVKVTLYYQNTSRDFAEFLRDNQPDPGNATNDGQLLYALWANYGKSAPIKMAVYPPPTVPDCNVTPDPDYPCGDPETAVGLGNVELKGDLDGDRRVTVSDIPDFAGVLIGYVTDARKRCAANFNNTPTGPDANAIQPFVNKLLAP